jgi:hypothetical protein
MRPNENEGKYNQYPESDIEHRKDPRREIVEYDRSDDPRNKGYVFPAFLRRRNTEIVFYIRQRAPNSEDGFTGNIENKSKMDNPKDKVPNPFPIKHSSYEYPNSPKDAERDYPEVNNDDYVSE